MHICFLSADYPTLSSGGGVGSQTRTLARALVRAGHKVSVVALAAGRAPEAGEEDGVAIYPALPGKRHWYVFRTPIVGPALALAVREMEYSLSLYRQLAALQRRAPVDLVEGTETGSFFASQLLQDLPFIIRLHGEQYTIQRHMPGHQPAVGVRLERRIQHVALRRARLLISPSQAHAREIAHELGSLRGKIIIIPNCIDSGVCAGLPPEPDAELAILYAGRLEMAKGVIDLLWAAPRVLSRFPQAKFLLAGASHPTLSAESLQAQIAGLGLAEHVRVLGHVPRDKLRQLYQTAAICVLPSYYETFGLAALEAMAHSVPVVATSAGGLPEVVQHGVTGLLVRPGDTHALGDAMLELLSDPDRRRTLGANGRARAHNHFHVDALVNLNVAAYGQVIGRGHSA